LSTPSLALQIENQNWTGRPSSAGAVIIIPGKIVQNGQAKMLSRERKNGATVL